MAEQKQLAKNVTLGQYFALSFGTIIGVGWVLALGEWLGNAGPIGSVIGFVLGAIAVSLIGLAYSEIATIIPVTGGSIAYNYKIYGSFIGFLTGWLLALSYIAVTAFETIFFAEVANYLFPGIMGETLYSVIGFEVKSGSLILGLGGTSIIAFLNYRGTKLAGMFQNILTYTLVTLALICIVAGMGMGSVGNLKPLFLEKNDSVIPGIIAIFVTVPFWFSGFEVIPQMMGEKSAGTSVKKAGMMIVISIIAAGVFYSLVIIASSMVYPWEKTTALTLPAASAFREGLSSPFFSYIVLLSALLGLLTTWNAIFIAATRVLYTIGKARMIPKIFGKSHSRYGSPSFAIVFVAVIAAGGAMFGMKALGPILSIVSFCLSLIYLFVCLGVILMRKSYPDTPRPIRIPIFIVIMAVISSGFLLYLGAKECSSAGWYVMLVWIVLGIVFWLSMQSSSKKISEEERQRLIFDN